MNDAAVKMGLAPLQPKDNKHVKFAVCPLRPDILHACDIEEEVGIGYGFNNIEMVMPPTNVVGSFIPQNKFTDILRHEVAQMNYIESLTFGLVSKDESYKFLRKEFNADEAITLANPKTIEF